MAKRAFKPILTDLELLSKDEQEKYVADVCEFLNVPPELGLVRLTLMDSGSGKRNMVLYVEKGATDIVRGNLGIDVESMDPVNGPGYVGWKVSGKDKNGRHEIAVGAVSVEGLKGLQAANAVMVAQTKACRRMTLQFMGGGFLDITEIGDQTVDVLNSAKLSKVPAQPASKPNVAAGKDTTEPAPAFIPTEPLKVGDWVDFYGLQKVVEATGVAPEKPARKPRRKKTASSDAPISGSAEAEFPAKDIPLAPDQQAPGPKAVAAAPAETAPAVVPTAVEPPAAEAERPSDGGTVTTPEQRIAYRAQLSKYLNEILPPAGFLQSTKLGSRKDKMKLFMQKMFPKANMKNLSVQQWDHFFMFMQSKTQELGPEGLVQLIHKTIKEEGFEDKPKEESDAE